MTHSSADETKVQHAAQGHGPLWQRDYCAHIRGSQFSPEEIIDLLRREFPAFSPEELAAFSKAGSTPLAVGEEMKVVIQGYGECGVRCIHVAALSFTLRTLEGHYEAGRITFGAREDEGAVFFHIRSRARTKDRVGHVGYKLVGQKLQEKTWTTFIERVAQKIGGEVDGEITVETKEAKATLADMGEIDTPTFADGEIHGKSSGDK